MKKIFSTFAALALLLLPLAGQAAEFDGGERYSLSAGETVEDDLYTAGGLVTVSGEVSGDLYTAGGNLTVTGNISQDLVAVGGQVNLLGTVGDDLRVFGGNITLASQIGSDAVLVGGTVQILSDTEVGQDLVVSGGALSLEGDVLGELRATGGDLFVNATVAEDVQLDAQEKITIGSDAVIEGNLVYSLPEGVDIVIEDGAVVNGEISRAESSFAYGAGVKVNKGIIAGLFTLFSLIKLIAILIAALVLFAIFPRKTQRFIDGSMQNKGENFLYGLVGAIVVPIVAGILMLTVVGWFLSWILIALFMVATAVAAVYSGVWFGSWMIRTFQKTEAVQLDWKVIVIGTFVLFIIAVIPFVGWLVAAVVWLIILGSLIRVCRNYYKLQ